MPLSQLKVTYEAIQNLVPYARNARTHSQAPDSSDRRQHANVRLHQSCSGRWLENDHRRPRSCRSRKTVGRRASSDHMLGQSERKTRYGPTFWRITSWRKKLVGTIRFLPSSFSI